MCLSHQKLCAILEVNNKAVSVTHDIDKESYRIYTYRYVSDNREINENYAQHSGLLFIDKKFSDAQRGSRAIERTKHVHAYGL